MKPEEVKLLTEEQKAQVIQEIDKLTPQQLYQMQKVAKSFRETQVKLILFFIMVVILFIVAWYVTFDPTYEYNWVYGWIVHSWIIIPKWIYSLFIDGVAIKPELYTTGYNVWWWISLVSWCVMYLSNIINFILYRKNKKDLKQAEDAVEIVKLLAPEKLEEAQTLAQE